MAEMAVWMRPESDVDELRSKIGTIVANLRSLRNVFGMASLGEEDGNGEDASNPSDAKKILNTLQELLELIEQDGNPGEVAAVEFGRRSGHVLLMSILDSSPDDEIRNVAAQAVEVCTEKCPRFPMKGSVIDPEDVNPLRCVLQVDSPLNATGHAITLRLIRRAHSPSDTDLNPSRCISNMLWAGSVVLVRYLQSQPHLLTHFQSAARPPSVLELGAGIGGGGLGLALMARAVGARARVCITDVDPDAVEVVRAAMRANSLATRQRERGGEQGAGEGVECRAEVLDWDRLEEFWGAEAGEGEGGEGEGGVEAEGEGGGGAPGSHFRHCDLIVGAEIIHEIPHAAGVYGAISSMLREDGVAVIVNGSSKHRYGVAEFQELLANDRRFEWSVQDVDERLTEDMESLREKMLQLQLYVIRWRGGAAPLPTAAVP